MIRNRCTIAVSYVNFKISCLVHNNRFCFLQVWCPTVFARSGRCVMLNFGLQDTLSYEVVKKRATLIMSYFRQVLRPTSSCCINIGQCMYDYHAFSWITHDSQTTPVPHILRQRHNYKRRYEALIALQHSPPCMREICVLLILLVCWTGGVGLWVWPVARYTACTHSVRSESSSVAKVSVSPSFTRLKKCLPPSYSVQGKFTITHHVKSVYLLHILYSNHSNQ